LNRFQPLHADQRPRDFAARLPRKARRKGLRDLLKQHARNLAVLVLAIGVPAFAAPSEWKAFPGFAEPEVAAVEPMGFETPGESFPGSAFYYLEDVPYAPAEPQAEEAPVDDTADLLAGPAARPFLLEGSQLDKARALQCLTLAVYYEAASESDAGQRAVAQVVLNRVAHPSYPNSVCGVVFQGSERNTGCQFTFTCDGSLNRAPARQFWDRAQNVATAALDGAVYRPVGLATHYHTTWVHPYWADSLTTVGTIGAHRFYRWRGTAGLPGAFMAAYAGHEPSATPHPKARQVADPAPDPVELARIYEQSHPASVASAAPQRTTVTPAYSPPPAYSAAIEARGGDALFTGSNLPQSGSVREEYAQSGQWLTRP